MLPILSGNVASALGGAYEVANSCRFNDDDTAYLHRTPGSEGNRKKWTFSCWFKRGNLGGGFHRIFGGNANASHIYFSDDKLYWDLATDGSGSVIGSLQTNRLFRDSSAFYHIVCALDTEQATAGNRMRMYINGTEETSFAVDTNPDEDLATNTINDTTVHTIGYRTSGQGSAGGAFDGYMAEVVFIDGLQLAASSFGEFDEDSPTIWKPIDVSGLTFGSQGFYLDFEDSGDLGDDESGNGNDWTEVNLAATDQATDTPTNNFCVINPLASNVTLSEGNLQFSGITNCKSSMAMQNGKWYAECKITNDNTYNPQIGIGQTGTEHMDNPLGDGYAGNTADSYHYERTGEINANGSDDAQTGLTTIAQNDIVGVAVDLDSGTKTCKWYINNTLRGTQNLSETGSNPYLFWTYASGSQAGEGQWNFGGCQSFTISSAQTDENGYGAFEYAPPSGYYALCTKNLVEYG